MALTSHTDTQNTSLNRKYLNRETKGAADAFDGTQKEIYLEKTPSESSAEEVIHVLGSDIKDVNDSISAMSKQILAQKARIEAIGKKQKDFDADVRAFQKNTSDPITGTEFENLGSEFESDKIIKGISMLVENEIQNRITNLEKQLDYEKKNSKIFSTSVEETLAKFLLVEKNLKSTNHKLEDEIREKTAQIIRSERLSAIGELASRLAHDLKNPLTVIKGTVQLLKHNNNGNIDELTKRRIEVIEKSIFRMTHQIDGVLDFVRESPLKKETSSLNEIIISAIQTMMVPSNVSIFFPREDIVFLCDPHKMQVVFANLILNSIQAIGTKKGKIAIHASKTEKDLLIAVEDDGPGIDPRVLGRIFDPLFTTKQEGTGLGLASVKNIVNQHGGKISASTNPTIFSIKIPLY